MKRSAIVVLTLLALVPLTSMPAAQAAPGVLYLSREVAAPPTACGAQGQGAPVNNYAMVEEKPAAGKAYTAMSGGGFSCPFAFRYTTTADTILSGEFQVFIQLGCDVAGQAIEFDYNFLVGGESVSGNQRPAVSYQCQGSSSLFTYRQTFVAKDVEVPAGTAVALNLNLFAAVQGPAGAPGNWHLKVGQADQASGVYGAGLPGGGPAVVAVPLMPAAVEQNVTAAPGEIAQFQLSLSNNGTAATTYNLTAAGLPGDFQATFDADNGTVEPGANATVALSVNVSATAAPGEYPFQVTVASEGVDAQMLNLTIVVEAASPTPTTETSTSASATSNATTEAAATPASVSDAAGIPGPAVVLAMIGIAATTLLLRRRS